MKRDVTELQPKSPAVEHREPWRELRVPPEMSVREVMRTIERGQRQIAIVADDAGHLVGTITDGDIRRSLLCGAGLDGRAADIMNPHPHTTRDTDTDARRHHLLRAAAVRCLPVVDRDGRVVGLFDGAWQRRQRDNPVVLMAGGQGQRLRPLTDTCPKPLLQIGGRPILETIIANIIESGLWDIKISINYRGAMIRDHFGNGEGLDVAIDYLYEDTPLGTAGALGRMPQTPDKPILVMNGDVLTKLDCGSLLDFHATHEAPVTVCVAEHFYTLPYGVMEVENSRLTSIREKPTQRAFVNAGIYVVDPEICAWCTGRIDMTDILARLCDEGRPPAVFPIHEYWADIGRMEDFHRVNAQFSDVFQ